MIKGFTPHSAIMNLICQHHGWVAKPSLGKKVRFANGFTLVETILAISILSVVIVTAGSLATSSIRIGGQNLHQFTAFHLAEEGIEVVRHLRDSNWLQNRPWAYGLGDGEYVIISDHALGRWALLPATDRAGASSALAAPFENYERTVALRTEGNAMQVESRVSYSEAGKEKIVTLNTELTNWK